MEDKNVASAVRKKISARRRRGPALRIIPMIDTIFLLLLFFLVTAKYRPAEDNLPLKIPVLQAQQDFSIAPEPLVIRIWSAQNGCTAQIANLYKVRINNLTVESDLTELAEKITACLSREIICQPSVRWEYIAKIYNVLYGMGLTDITFIMTEPADNEESGGKQAH
jgi:biopolymer transport protein ExbD